MAGIDITDKRPLSPHLQNWRWHATMYGSIFHRVTGVGLYGGALLICAWLVALSSGPEAYAIIDLILASPFGQLVMLLWLAATLYHLANGVRHLIWDGPGIGFDPRTASLWSVCNFAFAVLGTAAICFLS